MEQRGPTHLGRAVRRIAITSAIVPVAALGLVAGCGTTDEASRMTLPPLETTTTTTTTTTTIPQERFYTVQSGDILAVIASQRGVTVEAIVELNALESPDAIQAGQVLEIPANVQG
ncbi:LysM peptidoglycan-binding domain-containing protein [Ilumatobacter sp.]|uniref:LysM peptidoglycan-binding domain-containing protein n=1 Tax=Ilumatobacter sp. TaxID=1967498 RepID=UPI003C3EA8BD